MAKKKAAARTSVAKKTSGATRGVEILVEVNQRLARLEKKLAAVFALQGRVTDLEGLYHDQGVRLEQIAERLGLDDAGKP